MIVAAIFLLHAMYTFYRYSLRKDKSKKDLLYYAIMLTIAGFAILIDDDIVLQLPVQVETYYKILLFLFLSTLFFMLKFINHLFRIKSKFFRVLAGVFIFIVIGELIIPFQYFTFLGMGVAVFYVLSLVYLFIHTIKAIRQGHSDVIFILLFLTSYTSNIIWGAGIKLGIDFPFYPFDFLISIIVIALLMFRTYADIAHVNVEQLRELQIADEKKDEFLANTSHELRNPLHGIINITETILNDQTSALSSENRSNLKLLSRLGKQMTFTLNDILDISRLRDQRVQLNKENVNLHAVTAGVLDMVRFISDEKKLSLHLAIPPTFPEVHADENRLIQILFNLIHNAVKFTYEGSVTINATHKNNLAIIGVTDTGIGMDKQTQEVIFQRYKQADSSSTSISSGIGLGLNICKQLIELHGGTIAVESKIGQGSIFTFTIPLADVSSTKSENEKYLVAATLERDETGFAKNDVSPVSAKEKHDVKILVVDDDPVNLRVLVNILDINYDVTAATSGDEALKLLNIGTWDLVILDVMMPNMSGYELTRI